MGKVFGIGLSRTGTSSLAVALEMLGFRTAHYLVGYELYVALEVRPATVTVSAINSLDAVTDLPMASLYQALDEGYGGSKFILTVREEEAWHRSCEAFFRLGRKQPETSFERRYACRVLKEAYGVLYYERNCFELAYREHIAGVLGYFGAGRGDDLLVLDICGGEGWEKLCPFLGLPEPKVSFPWEHRIVS